YHWSHTHEVANDPLLTHKAPYLNLPFWTIRLVIYFALWILMFVIIRRLSLKEDVVGGLDIFKKLEHRSKVFIFIVIIPLGTVPSTGFRMVISSLKLGLGA
ncbi:unnamed protein product, partial [marine sediment metagenome]